VLASSPAIFCAACNLSALNAQQAKHTACLHLQVSAKAGSSVPCSTASGKEYAQELYEAVLAARKAGKIVVLGTDIDGTLISTPGTGEMGTLPDDVYQALKIIKKDPNLLVVPATGRILADALTAVRHLPGAVVGGISLDAKKLMQESEAAFAVLRPMAKNALQQQADSAAAAHIKTVDELSESDLDSCSSDDDTEAAAGGADLALAEAGGLGEGKGLHANTIMWRRMEQLPAAATLYGETMRVAKLGMTMVATSVMDERAFSAMSFIKNRLRARLTKSLQLCMRAKLQQHFNVDTFPYGSVF
jgi:hypothetical protein